MKKKLALLLLAGIMMFGTCTNVYAAEKGCDFAATSTDFYTRSYTPIWYVHIHDYTTLNIKAYKKDNSNYKMVISTRSYDTWDDEFVTTVYPSTYNDGSYVGRYFVGKQICKVSVTELGYYKECIATVK